MRSAFLELGLKIATFDNGRGIVFSRMPPCLPACRVGLLMPLHRIDALDDHDGRPGALPAPRPAGPCRGLDSTMT